ncbi:MAG: NAD(P)-binding domain-containing protein [Bacteroidales bacterium]|jgi:predicted dinucleotide-binding enzyme|nr:NAD(P)-binding domain-containing protein [Bacteroidales bacterium]
MKKYGVLGTGDVARVIASKLVELGNEVMMGSRSAANEKATAWARENGERASNGTFADAAAFGEVVFNCVKGVHALEALGLAGADNLRGKILVDQSNPYVYRDGHISLDPAYSGDTCLGEEVQRFLPETKVVKTLNFIGSVMMTNPGELAEAPTAFYCGNDAGAKEAVKGILNAFGWTDTFDMGDISMSRYTEMLGAFWVPLFGQLGTMHWGFRLVTDLK